MQEGPPQLTLHLSKAKEHIFGKEHTGPEYTDFATVCSLAGLVGVSLIGTQIPIDNAALGTTTIAELTQGDFSSHPEFALLTNQFLTLCVLRGLVDVGLTSWSHLKSAFQAVNSTLPNSQQMERMVTDAQDADVKKALGLLDLAQLSLNFNSRGYDTSQLNQSVVNRLLVQYGVSLEELTLLHTVLAGTIVGVSTPRISSSYTGLFLLELPSFIDGYSFTETFDDVTKSGRAQIYKRGTGGGYELPNQPTLYWTNEPQMRLVMDQYYKIKEIVEDNLHFLTRTGKHSPLAPSRNN